jgi:hypothetical protein
LQWRRILRMTSAWVMAAMMRSVPRPHAGPRAMAKAKTRFSSRALYHERGGDEARDRA